MNTSSTPAVARGRRPRPTTTIARHATSSMRLTCASRLLQRRRALFGGRRADARSCRARCPCRSRSLRHARAGGDRGADEHAVAPLGERSVRRQPARSPSRPARSRRSARASFAVSACASSSRASAATMSPASSRSRSPGTISVAAIIAARPSRITRARGAVIDRSASTARSARYSWMKPTNALMHDDRADRDRIGHLAEQLRDDRGAEQEQYDRARELPRKNRHAGVRCSRRSSFAP